MDIQKMLSLLRKGISTYKMIKDGDKIAVGVSGGKDSVALLKLLSEYKKFSPEKFDLVAITIDLNHKDNPQDFSPIKKLCSELGVEYEIVKTDIGEIVFHERKESNPCSLCSKMRKGALYDTAKKHGANKVAIGHHKDDLIDTFILSLVYEGRLSTFHPKSYLSKTDLTLIRPMIMIKECDVYSFSKTLPVVKNTCPADKNTKREEVKTFVKNMEPLMPNVREMIFSAITHPDRYNLFDKVINTLDEF
jgi:tRNA(Ile)-lysidine synthase TilS/MesJ